MRGRNPRYRNERSPVVPSEGRMASNIAESDLPSQRMALASRSRPGARGKRVSARRSGRTRRMPPRRTRMRACSEKATGRRATFANGGTGGGSGLERAVARGRDARRRQELLQRGLRRRLKARGIASFRYAISQGLRKRIEECFGWAKMVGGLAQVKVRGLDMVRAVFVFGIAAYNLVRLPKLLASTGEVCPTA